METNFETILLSNLLKNNTFFGKSMPIIKSEYFMDVGNQETFKLLKTFFSKQRNIPTAQELVIAVKNVPNNEIRSEIVSTLKTINSNEPITNIDFLLEETLTWVKDSLYYKALQVGSDGLMNKDDNLKLKAQKIMDERAKVSIDSDLGLDLDDIDAMIEYYSERLTGIRTQHKELNKRLGPGFLPGTLSLILAASGIGKSLLMTDLISGMVKKGKNILLVSLEMSDKEIMKRVHANAMDLPINSLIDLAKTPGELERITDRPVLSKEEVLAAYNKMKADGNVGKFFIKDYPAGSFSPLMLEQLVESYKIERDIEFDAIFVDYMGIMKSDLLSPSAGLYSYIKSIAEELRASAKKMELPIISASQLNRSATNNVDDADNSAVSDSMGSVMTADFMLFLLQNEEMKERKEIVCKVTKNRFAGRTDTWLMNIDYEHMRFNDMLIQNAGTDIGITETPIGVKAPVDADFGLITPAKQAEAEVFANQEVKDIAREDATKLMNSDKPDPFKNDIEDIYKELGL